MAVSLTGEPGVLASSRAAAEAFVARLPEAKQSEGGGPTIADMKQGGVEALLYPTVDEAFIIPSQVRDGGQGRGRCFVAVGYAEYEARANR